MVDQIDRAAALFRLLLLMLVASFALLPEELQRNWLLYLTASVGLMQLLDPAHRRRLRHHRPGIGLLAILALPVLSLLWASAGADPVDSSDAIKDALVAALCIVGVYVGLAHHESRHPGFERRLFHGLVITALTASWIALAIWWFTLRADAPRPRFEGAWTFINPVHASIFVTSVGVLSIKWWLDGSDRGGLVALATNLTALVLLSVAGARTAAAAYVVIFAGLILTHRPRLALPIAAAVAVIVAAAVGVVGLDDLESIWLSRGLSFRLEIWQQVIDQTRDCSVFVGCGLTTPLFIDTGLEQGERAHSIYLALFYHQGLIGLVVNLLALGLVLRHGLQRGKTPWLGMVGCGLLANLTSGDHLLVRAELFWMYFWLPLLVIAGSSQPLPHSSGNAPRKPA
ncbi:MAG: O-antigen ligase family protein [Pseudomonadota bacterium]